MASDFTVPWQYSQRAQLFFLLQIKLHAHNGHDDLCYASMGPLRPVL
jgi:hypothetical protein